MKRFAKWIVLVAAVCIMLAAGLVTGIFQETAAKIWKGQDEMGIITREKVEDNREMFNELPFIPGDVFREYKWNGPWVNAHNWQRVTDMWASHAGALEFLPNPINEISIDDLGKAIKAEICIEMWGGHAGTSDKKFRINGSEWMQIPESPHIGPGKPESYMQFRYPVVSIPLELLKEGKNTFEFGCGKQITHDFGWGQWGFYGVIFRIYYSSGKPFPGAEIISPAPGSTFEGDIMPLKIEENKTSVPIRHVEYLGYYEGFDYDGDGLYQEWQYSYRNGEMRHHLGTAKESPYTAEWDTRWVPDQNGPVSIMALVTDVEGITYVTPAVTGIIIERDFSVRMYKPYDMPENWMSRDYNRHSCKVDLQDDLNKAVEAKLIVTTWHGMGCEEFKVNGRLVAQAFGRDHDYSLDIMPVPIDILWDGVNEFSTFSTTEHHGIEVLWPGVVLKIKYTK